MVDPNEPMGLRPAVKILKNVGIFYDMPLMAQLFVFPNLIR
jgi:hypothetical protein